MISGDLTDVVGEMRGWLADCGYVNAHDVTDRMVARLVQGLYEGGTHAFVRDTVGVQL